MGSSTNPAEAHDLVKKADAKIRITRWISLMIEISPGAFRERRVPQEVFLEEMTLGL